MNKIHVFGEADEGTFQQIVRCVTAEDGALGALMGDNHLGYSMPIGGVVAYEDHISPSGVGYDIGCGNKAVKTNVFANDVSWDLPGIMDEIYSKISFGMGRKNQDPVDHWVLDMIDEAEVPFQRELSKLAADQLGTVGAGNHYVDLFKDEDGWLWVGVHFGSRGFGHKTATYFLERANQLDINRDVTNSMDSPPTLIPVDSVLGQEYIEAMNLAGEYAYAGRDVVVTAVLGILGANAVEQVHNHHNFAWQEKHFGRDLWVIRKGATPAFPGQRGFVGSTMGEESVILEGADRMLTVSSIEEKQQRALYSTIHGAGRAMSRTAATGKTKRRKRYACMHRDCDRVFEIDGVSAHNAAPTTGVCPDHPESRIKKIWISEQVSEGRIDWEATLEDLSDKGIELRGGAADEAPLAYKRLSNVLESQEGTVKVLHRLTPIGVAMAGSNTYDAYKD